MDDPTIRTVRAPLVYEPAKVKGSRFVAALAPAASAEAAMALVEARRAALRGASHHCFAWRGGDEGFRWHDDGEPSGTAGRPILQEIDGRGLIDVAVVVSRYFGGTKLGTGGLIRAYGGAAAAVLERAEIVERPVTETLELRFPYPLDGPVRGVLARFGLSAEDAGYGEDVRLRLAVPVLRVDELRRALAETGAGRVTALPSRNQPGAVD